MPSPRYMRSPTRSRAKGDPEPPPLGTGDCNTKYALNVYSVHNLSTGRRRPVDKSSETFHSLAYLSTVSVDNSALIHKSSTRNLGLSTFLSTGSRTTIQLR